MIGKLTKMRRRDAEALCLMASQYEVRALRQVSLPIEYSVPGTLLLMVAGNSIIGIRNAG